MKRIAEWFGRSKLPGGGLKKFLKWMLRLAVAGVLVGVTTVIVTYLVIAPDLPDVETLRDVRLQVPLRVYTEDGRLISTFGEKRRIPVAIENIPLQLQQAFIAGEDQRFYEHPGVDYQGVTRAVWTLATTGEKRVGGSTITQLLARNYFLTLEKTYSRKIREIFLALKIEREFSKDEILELFLNKILLGHRAYGIGAAAEVYYGKTLDELTLAQSAMIAALPKAPSRINPITSPERAMERRDYVLERMLEDGYITQEAFQQALEEADNAFYHGASIEVSAPYLAEMVRQMAIRQLGNDAYTGGYVVRTTIDSGMQSAANVAVKAGLEDYDRRHGYRGAEARVDLAPSSGPADWAEILAPYRPIAGLVPGLVIEVDEEIALVFLKNGQTIALGLPEVQWAKKFISRNRFGNDPESLAQVLQLGDIIRTRIQNDGSWRLAQQPDAEASLVSLDPSDGAIKALVGGYDFSRSKFNRVTQSRRQPGSSFKPFLYSASLERGFTTATLINDAPIVFEDDELERTWKPQNFSEKFFGPTRMREAMVNSRNLVSIRILRDIGVGYAREYIAGFGFDADTLPSNLSMALGSADVPPLSMARGYATFANGGHLIEPFYIWSIKNADGLTVYRANPAVVCDDCTLAYQPVEEEFPESGPVEPAYRPLDITVEDQNDLGNRKASAVEADLGEVRQAQRIITEQNAYLVRSMMTDVVRRGTGRKALEIGREDLAGKTGTTNDQRDAWFSGYNNHLVTTVWLGFDNHDPLGRAEVGGRAALPIWVEFMGAALEGLPDELPELPPGLVQARIDPDTGLLAALDNPDAIMEVFQAGRLPQMEESLQGVKTDATTEEDPYDIY
jgi:penicillin-binding protein 1A